MNSEENVRLMQQGTGRGAGRVYAIVRYDTLEQRFFPFQARSAIKHPMIHNDGAGISPSPRSRQDWLLLLFQKKW